MRRFGLEDGFNFSYGEDAQPERLDHPELNRPFLDANDNPDEVGLTPYERYTRRYRRGIKIFKELTFTIQNDKDTIVLPLITYGDDGEYSKNRKKHLVTNPNEYHEYLDVLRKKEYAEAYEIVRPLILKITTDTPWFTARGFGLDNYRKWMFLRWLVLNFYGKLSNKNREQLIAFMRAPEDRQMGFIDNLVKVSMRRGKKSAFKPLESTDQLYLSGGKGMTIDGEITRGFATRYIEGTDSAQYTMNNFYTEREKAAKQRLKERAKREKKERQEEEKKMNFERPVESGVSEFLAPFINLQRQQEQIQIERSNSRNARLDSSMTRLRSRYASGVAEMERRRNAPMERSPDLQTRVADLQRRTDALINQPLRQLYPNLQEEEEKFIPPQPRNQRFNQRVSAQRPVERISIPAPQVGRGVEAWFAGMFGNPAISPRPSIRLEDIPMAQSVMMNPAQGNVQQMIQEMAPLFGGPPSDSSGSFHSMQSSRRSSFRSAVSGSRQSSNPSSNPSSVPSVPSVNNNIQNNQNMTSWQNIFGIDPYRRPRANGQGFANREIFVDGQGPSPQVIQARRLNAFNRATALPDFLNTLPGRFSRIAGQDFMDKMAQGGMEVRLDQRKGTIYIRDNNGVRGLMRLKGTGMGRHPVFKLLKAFAAYRRNLRSSGRWGQMDNETKEFKLTGVPQNDDQLVNKVLRNLKQQRASVKGKTPQGLNAQYQRARDVFALMIGRADLSRQHKIALLEGAYQNIPGRAVRETAYNNNQFFNRLTQLTGKDYDMQKDEFGEMAQRLQGQDGLDQPPLSRVRQGKVRTRVYVQRRIDANGNAYIPNQQYYGMGSSLNLDESVYQREQIPIRREAARARRIARAAAMAQAAQQAMGGSQQNANMNMNPEL